MTRDEKEIAGILRANKDIHNCKLLTSEVVKVNYSAGNNSHKYSRPQYVSLLVKNKDNRLIVGFKFSAWFGIEDAKYMDTIRKFYNV